ncbi:MAG: C39 family peptidase [Armatimonadetes bacterium]|nr:C39 family peptidase [Armatimonadota bacterium]
MNRAAFLRLLALLPPATAAPTFATNHNAVNPKPGEVRDEVIAVAREYRIPSVILCGLAWHASRFRQFGDGGKPVETAPGRVGILSVPVETRADAERLRSDWRHNIREGAKLLVHAWNRAPLPGTSRLPTGRNILECWFFALGWYGTGGRGGFRGREGDAADAFANAVLNAAETGGNGLWQPVRVTRPTPEALVWGRNLRSIPAPWHYGDVPPLPEAQTVVNLEVPYLQQAWDAPDGFDGAGSCGPCASLMVLLWAKKIAPKPVTVRDSYPHTSAFGGAIPNLQKAICEPGRGAIHAKMLTHLRPSFAGVAIFYNAKATWPRVKAELDAGRPVILGTRVTPAGHLMVARGYLSDGRVIVNDPAGDREQLARKDAPTGRYSPTGSRYFNGGGAGAIYEWEALDVRWVMTFGDVVPVDADRAEDE